MLCRKKEEQIINIVDSIMGSGKTSWAIQYMNNAPDYQKFLYITPYKNEVERIINTCVREFMQPQSDRNGETKLEDIKRLVREGKNIASTHALFQRIDSEFIDLLEMENYILILDEVMNVIEQIDTYSNSDLNMLYNKKIIEVDKNGLVLWKQNDYQDGYFERIRNLANSNRLMMYEDSNSDPLSLYWTFPVDVFQSFEEVYILTYMFDGQIQRAYFNLFNQKYNYYSIESKENSYQLSDYVPFDKEERKHLKELINIFYSKRTDKNDMNKIGSKPTVFSVSDLKKRTKTKETVKLIKDRGYNFYRHKCGVSSDEVMWTTYKQFKGKIFPKGLKDQFVSVNARATNEYQHKSTCIYFANIYVNPVLQNFFSRNQVKLNVDLYALSELLQWLFRSRIRIGKSINVYIPSIRMRTLLEKYLNNQM